MPLSYRAQLIPTAALDSAGNAKAGATFTVSPQAGGSAVAVYAAAEGGSPLAAGDVKTDSLGNISGFYVAEPGAYSLSFAGGGTVVTSAIMDSRDVATQGDLVGLGSGAVTPPDYDYNADTDTWTVTPGQNPGCAIIEGHITIPTTDGHIIFDETWRVENSAVATRSADPADGGTVLRVAESGLYLFSVSMFLIPSDPETPGVENLAYISVTGGGPVFELTKISSHYNHEVAGSMPVLCHPDEDVRVYVNSGVPWGYDAKFTIVRLD